ncbi:MAG: TetR family transcriptional regulator [Acidimicrobiales bacterium]
MERRLRNQARAPRSEKAPKRRSHAGGASVEAAGGFPVSVLAERTGTLVPTIHHYRYLGLLPEATALASNRFLYDERHVEALIMIRLLRDRRSMPLEAIRGVLPDLLLIEHEGGSPADIWDDVIVPYLDRSSPDVVRGRLVVTAREAFALHGYAQVNVADLCREAGIAKGSFYRYFDSKEAIFLAAAHSTVEVVGQQFDELPSGLSERQAVEKLQLMLGPMAPLLLEVASGELRHQANVAGVVAAIAAGLAAHVMPRLVTRGQAAVPVARRVVDSALVGLLRPALGAMPSSPA